MNNLPSPIELMTTAIDYIQRVEPPNFYYGVPDPISGGLSSSTASA